MKKQLLTKTLLLATGLLVEASAWAYDVPEGFEVKNVFLGTLTDGVVSPENFNGGTISTAWSATNLYSNVGSTLSITDKEEVAKPDVGSAVATTEVVDGEGNITTVNVVPTYVGGKVLQGHYRDGKNKDNDAVFSFDKVSTGKLVFSGDFFNDDNKALYVRFVDAEGNEILNLQWSEGSGTRAFNYRYTSDGAESATTGATGNLCTYRTYKGFGIKDLVIDMETGAAEFTIDYIDRYNKRQQTKVSNFNVGTGKNIAALRVGYNGGASKTNYYWQMDNFELYTVGVETGSFGYTIKAVANNETIEKITSGSCKGGMTYSVEGLPKVIEKDGKFYVLNDATVDGYKKTFLMGNADEEQEIAYTEDATIVYFGEVENLSNAVYPAEGNYSGGKCAAINGSRIAGLTTLPAAVYEVSGYVKSNDFRGLVLRKSNSTAEDQLLVSITSSTANMMTGEFSLVQPTSVNLSGKTQDNGKINQSADLDYIIIRKTADLPATVTATPGLNEYTTFASPYNLDLSNLGEAKAYTATLDGTTLKFEACTTAVPAGTGLLIQADEAVEIPVYTEAATAVDGNALTGVITDTDLQSNAEGNYIFVMKKATKADDELAFAPLTTAKVVTVPAGKAYVSVPATAFETSTSRALRVSFDGETTGVRSIESASVLNRGVYNLNGQRVSQPQHGLYIVNGNKVIIK